MARDTSRTIAPEIFEPPELDPEKLTTRQKSLRRFVVMLGKANRAAQHEIATELLSLSVHEGVDERVATRLARSIQHIANVPGFEV